MSQSRLQEQQWTSRSVSNEPAPPPPSDLEQIRSGMEALLHRLHQVNGKLSYFYGDVHKGDTARPTPGGMIPQIGSLIEDLSDAVGAAEVVVNRL